MPSVLVSNKKRYIYSAYIGDAKGIIRNIKEWYWSMRLESMSEGEILRRYYELTKRESEAGIWQ